MASVFAEIGFSAGLIIGQNQEKGCELTIFPAVCRFGLRHTIISNLYTRIADSSGPMSCVAISSEHAAKIRIETLSQSARGPGFLFLR